LDQPFGATIECRRSTSPFLPDLDLKTFRIWLLVLLAVLLPIRGAVAAAMLCPTAGVETSGVAMTAHDGMHQAMAAVMAEGHGAHQDAHQHSGAPEAGGHHDGVDKCGLCCDLCSMTPMMNSASTVALPLNFGVALFTEPFTPAPSFLSDGQERPPRTI
jgi:hypothetical protein